MLELLQGRRLCVRLKARCSNDTFTYGELFARVARVANALRSLGVKPGERMVCSVVDDIEFPALFLGAMKMGAIAIPINTYLKPDDYRYYIADSEAATVIADHTIASVTSGLRHDLPSLRNLICARERVPGIDHFDDVLSTQPAQSGTHPVDPDDMAFWLYSSGSTGKPKGVVHTGNHIFWATEFFGRRPLEMSEDDVVLSPPKMYFAFGLGNQVYFPIRTGAQVIVNPAPISADTVLEQSSRYEPAVQQTKCACGPGADHRSSSS